MILFTRKGIFTSPYDGTYIITFTMMADMKTTGLHHIYIHKNDAQIEESRYVSATSASSVSNVDQG